jgi:hypothetical protein
MQARMLGHPGACLSTVMATQVIGDNKNVASRIVSFDVGKERDIVRRVA